MTVKELVLYLLRFKPDSPVHFMVVDSVNNMVGEAGKVEGFEEHRPIIGGYMKEWQPIPEELVPDTQALREMEVED